MDKADNNEIKVFAIDIDGTLTENGNGLINLSAASKLRFLERFGFKVIFVTGRSSIEAYVLSVFLGTTRISVGENGGVVTTGPQEHTVLGNKEECLIGYEILKKSIPNTEIKAVFPRMSEVVLLRTFDIDLGKSLLKKNKSNLYLNDSKYAFHINEIGIDKATGLKHALKMLKVPKEKVVAIGDSETDIPIFDHCGYSVALGHSEQEVKKHADHIVLGREGIGLSEAIDHVSIKFFSDINKK